MSHPTKEKLIATVQELLAQHAPETITVEMVLNKSGISKGSLYHHFEDFPNLIEETLIHIFTVSVDLTITRVGPLLDNVKSRADLLEVLKGVTRSTQSAEQRATRFNRARVISMSEHNERLQKALLAEQARMTAALTQMFQKSQQAGWMSMSFDAASAAVLIQAYTLGRIVDDVTAAPLPPDGWNLMIDRVIEKVFCED